MDPSDPAAPQGPLSPVDLATLRDPGLPARHEETPQKKRTPGRRMKTLDQGGSYLRSGGAADTGLPLVDTVTSGQKQKRAQQFVCKGLQ